MKHVMLLLRTSLPNLSQDGPAMQVLTFTASLVHSNVSRRERITAGWSYSENLRRLHSFAETTLSGWKAPLASSAVRSQGDADITFTN